MANGHPGLLRRFAGQRHDGRHLLLSECLGAAWPGLVAQELDDARLELTRVLLECYQAVVLIHPALAPGADAGRVKSQPGSNFWIATAGGQFEDEPSTLRKLLRGRPVRFKPLKDAADGWRKGQFSWKSERRHGHRVTRQRDLQLASFAPSYAFRRCCTSATFGTGTTGYLGNFYWQPVKNVLEAEVHTRLYSRDNRIAIAGEHTESDVRHVLGRIKHYC